MIHSPTTMSPFDAALEELGPDRSPVAGIRTAAHAAYARRARRASSYRLAASLGLTAAEIRRAIRDGIGC